MSRLKQLKDFKPKLPKSKIEDIIDNPEEWAEEFAQFVLETEGKRILEEQENQAKTYPGANQDIKEI